MAYVFINPVTAGMTVEGELGERLSAHGHTRVTCREDWVQRVRAGYAEFLRNAGRPVLDTRCPRAAALAAELPGGGECVAAPVLPILLSCGRELAQREDLADGDKIITAPCSFLAGAGNALGLPRTRFVLASQFLEEIGYKGAEPLNKSPIPLGFFDSITDGILCISGEAEIVKAMGNKLPPWVRLVEMLYCPGGCHCGDGVYNEAKE